MLCIDYVEVHRAEGETSERRHANFGCNRPRAKRAATDRQSHHSSAGNIETILDLSADYVCPTLRCDARQCVFTQASSTSFQAQVARTSAYPPVTDMLLQLIEPLTRQGCSWRA